MRNLFILAAIAAFAISGWTTTAVAVDVPTAGHDDHHAACAKACGECQLQCDMCFKYCLAALSDGKKDHAATVRTCSDCAEFCKLSATLCARHSSFSTAACECCAKCCEECATACEKFADDKHMAACAKSCRNCEKACREMVKMNTSK